MKRLMILIALALLHCQPRSASSDQPRQSPLERFKMHVTPAGEKCDVLLIESELILDSAMVEDIHYGIGAHDVDRGGIYGAYRNRDLRGVVYKDSTGAIWVYGDVPKEKAASLRPCR